MFDRVQRHYFEQSLASTATFRRLVRPAVQVLAKGDHEKMHELALKALDDYEGVLQQNSALFRSDRLKVDVLGNGKKVEPLAITAGFVKNAEALPGLSYVFPTIEVGTVVLARRDGNKRPRVHVDMEHGVAYNAQGFPSEGLDVTLDRLQEYRRRPHSAQIIVSICGLPGEGGPAQARSELKTLADAVSPYADGISFNSYSPNSAVLEKLRTEEEFRRSAEIIEAAAHGKPRLVKMGPYDDNAEERAKWFRLAGAWLDGGGTGLIAVNTYKVPRDKIPVSEWGYESAGVSGRFLQPYRRRAVREARAAFPKATILAVGGVDSDADVIESMLDGANGTAGYTTYMLNGLGQVYEILKGIERRLDDGHYRDLQALLNAQRGHVATMPRVSRIPGS